MIKYLDELKSATSLILDENRDASTLRPEVLEIGGVFKDLAAMPFTGDDIANGETVTEQGLAISPQMAAMCLDDYMRTIMYLRGLHEAIQTHEGKTHVLYVGCGPFATLALPLMAALDASQVSFTIVDVHKQSTEKVESLIEKLGFQGMVKEVLTLDAFHLQIAEGQEPDVIITEIMQAALEKEPQVAVSHHLISQAPQAVLIPEDISLYLKFYEGMEAMNDLGAVFSVNKKILLEHSYPLESPMLGEKVTFPQLGQTHHPMVSTEITVFGKHRLGGNDSGLTLPRVIKGPEGVKKGDQLQFYYELGEHPYLTYTIG